MPVGKVNVTKNMLKNEKARFAEEVSPLLADHAESAKEQYKKRFFNLKKIFELLDEKKRKSGEIISAFFRYRNKSYNPSSQVQKAHIKFLGQSKEIVKKINKIMSAGNKMDAKTTKRDKTERLKLLFDTNSVAEIAGAVISMPQKKQEDFLDIVTHLTAEENLATSLILEVIKQQKNISDSDIAEQYNPFLLSAMSVGHINQWVSNIYEVHKAGRLNLGILSSLSYAQIAILGFKDDEEFKMLMESTDPVLQKDSFAVKILAENKNATQSLNEDSRALKQYIAHTMIVPSKMESDPDTVKKFTAQCNFILKDRLLRQAEKNRDTAFKFMIDSWERISMHDIEAYNNGLPPETRLDVSSDAFQNELSKLDSRYFTQIANGESIDPAAKGWEPCGEHLQQAGDAKRKSSQEAILSDFFFHHAPGIKH